MDIAAAGRGVGDPGGVVESISDPTVMRALKKTNTSHISAAVE